MAMRSKIVGTGMYVPNRVVTNDDLAARMDTSDEWIQQRTGIQERRWIEDGQTPADLGKAAIEQALEQANLEVSDIDCLLLATLSSQHDFPGSSFFVHEALDMGEIPCIDLRAQCSGFLYALNIADGLVIAGKFKRVLVMGCEVHSTGLDVSTRGRDVSVIFGDGAGAVIVEAQPDDNDPAGIVEVRMHAEGKFARKLWIDDPVLEVDPAIVSDLSDLAGIDPPFRQSHSRRAAVVVAEHMEDARPFDCGEHLLRLGQRVRQRLLAEYERLRDRWRHHRRCTAPSVRNSGPGRTGWLRGDARGLDCRPAAGWRRCGFQPVLPALTVEGSPAIAGIGFSAAKDPCGRFGAAPRRLAAGSRQAQCRRFPSPRGRQAPDQRVRP